MWMKIDDGLHAHRKTRAVTRSHHNKTRDAAPMGLWVLAGSWSARNNRDGWVPAEELDRFDDHWEELAKRLVHAGYWWPEQRDGENGYGFNDWQEWNNPDGASASGSFGNHVRWHVNKGVVKPDCEHCPAEPDSVEDRPESGASRPDDRPDIAPESAEDHRPESGGESLRDHRPESLTRTRPEPIPIPEPKTVSSALAVASPDVDRPDVDRPDVDRICDHLADRIAEDGSKRPTIGKTWRDAARLMLDKDGRTETEVHAAIDWCQNHHFWRSNILSLPKLREKYDQLRKVAQTEQRRPTRQQETDDLFARAAARMGLGGDR